MTFSTFSYPAIDFTKFSEEGLDFRHCTAFFFFFDWTYILFLGCYSSVCEDGMLKIIIRNVTFECKYAGQIIDVALLKEKWLHEGKHSPFFRQIVNKQLLSLHNFFFSEIGTVICPRCSTFCENCENESNEDTLDNTDDKVNDDLKENLDEICRRDSSTKFFTEFAQALGLGNSNSDLFSWIRMEKICKSERE